MSLPKGGGAIHGIGEKFGVNPVTGTGSLSVPLVSGSGRDGFGPSLSLAYDSGAGNSPFGFGWSLSLPAITRKTDKGLARYADDAETDVFLLSGAEDLVPILGPDGKRAGFDHTVHEVAYRIRLYRPRIEGLFARIERWTEILTGTSHWRTITRDNIVTVFGRDDNSRVRDPNDPRRVHSWLIAFTADNKGNITRYDYRAEDSLGIDPRAPSEAHRTAGSRGAQRYLKYVRSANKTPWFPDWSAAGTEPPLPGPDAFHFTIAIDYGDHDPTTPTIAPQQPWPVRPDPFSTYRSRFEVRTYRRCRRVLLFHDFPGEATIGGGALVRATELAYADDDGPPDPSAPIYSYLNAITQAGFHGSGTARVRATQPPLELDYSRPVVDPAIHTFDDPDSFSNLPEGIDGSRFRWIDLDGEGLSGILTEDDGGWHYKRNLSPLNRVASPFAQETAHARFAPAERIERLPVPGLGGNQQFLDLDGNGQLELVALGGPMPGYRERTADENWGPFCDFPQLPAINWSDPNLQFVDLTGDGLADALMTADDAYTLYRSLGLSGFADGERIPAPSDEERGPHLVYADGTATIFFADMTGDGLRDLVRVRNGETCYWPNIGYGHFSAKVTMDGAPRFDRDELFDAKRIRLADIDGSGSTDILYLGRTGVQLYFNCSGNGWAEPQRLAVFPDASTLSNVQVIDLLGNGTACLVWSSPLPATADRPLRYVDLMGSQKPHLLVGIRNNLGAETRLRYAPSTRFYLEDRTAGRPWATKLPFPVHVVERSESYDWIGRSRFVSRYAYHHGYFDGVEREFRGFGLVEQWDTETHRGDTLFPDADAANEEPASFAPPVLTRSWFHTGAFADAPTLARAYARDYWIEPTLRGDSPAAVAGRAALLLPDNWIDPLVTADERREAYRALKGSPLRTEIFGLDGSDRQDVPYSIKEQNFGVRRIQGFGPNQHASFLCFSRESLTYHYERDTSDPRVAHDVTLAVDDFGNVTRSASIGYPRRPGFAPPEPHLSAAFGAMLQHDQTRLHIGAAGHGFTDPIQRPEIEAPFDAYRGPMPKEAVTAELTGFAPAGARFTFDEIAGRVDTLWAGHDDIAYEEVSTPDIEGIGAPIGLARRVVEHALTLYRSDLLDALLPLGTAGSLGLPGESYRLAFTPGLIERIFAGKVDDAMLAEGGYVQLAGDTGWWAPSGRVYYSPDDAASSAAELAEAKAHFFHLRRSVDPFGAIERRDYDDYDLLPVKAVDARGNTSLADNDYRVLAPFRSTDVNGNFHEAAFDALGRVAGVATSGKAGEGDSLTGFVPDLTDAQLTVLRADPLAAPGALLAKATARIVYDDHAYFRTRASATPDAPMSYSLSRETHVADLAAATETRYQHRFTYSDGVGHEIQHKALAEPGPVEGVAGTVSPRWVGSGWTIYNNKGKPVRRYEPFFSVTHDFEFAAQHGVSAVLFYDAAERAVATLHPDSTFEKNVFTGWAEWDWDANDTALIDDPRTDADVGDFFRRLLGDAPGAFTSWYQARIGGTLGATADDRAANKDAAQKVAPHAGTPAAKHFDTLGRTCLRVADNGPDDDDSPQRYATRIAMDTESKPLVLIDALGRHVSENCRREPIGGGGSGFRYVAGYDLLGHPLYHASMDGGGEWLFGNVAGHNICRWDARGFTFRTAYDLLQRATHHYVDDGHRETLSERLVYGDHHPDASLNLKGRLFRHYDGAGLASHERHDFKGNAIESARQLAVDYRDEPDWSPLAALGEEAVLDLAALDGASAGLLVTADRFVSKARYDALNRPVQTILPHTATAPPSVIQPAYNEANLLESLAVWVRAAAEPTDLLDASGADIAAVTGVEYNEHGQRTRIAHGNGAITSSVYDPLTRRLVSLVTARADPDPDARTVQALSYTYDPHGNVTRIRDDADIHNVVFFRNQRVDPTSDYSYDPIYRLLTASGREQLGLTGAGALKAPVQASNDDGSRMGMAARSDGNALGVYTERYGYDAVGNLLQMVHQVASGNWTRRYAYQEPSSITPGEICNRLSATSLPGDTAAGPYTDKYTYDAHGNMTRMPHLPAMGWDAHNRLQSTTRQVVVAGTPETTIYCYGSDGNRVRKVTERQAAVATPPTRKSERLYLAGIEIYREYAADGTTVTLARESLDVLLDHRRLAIIETRYAGTDPGPAQLIRYQFGNHLGSTSLELDPTADIISYEEYFPYGATAYQAVRSTLETPKRYRYSGKERDEENDLAYHGERYYAPWLGRWTACDPSGAADGPNVYMYVHGNPVAFSDPTGMWGWRQVAIVAAVVVVGTVVTVATAGVAGPIVAGAIASVGLSGAAATVATGVVVGAVAGAAGGAASELTRQVASGEQVSARKIGRAALEGAALGAVTGGLSAAATTVRGAAAISRAATAARATTAGRTAAAAGRAVAAGGRAVARVPGVRQAVQAAGALARGGGRALGAIEQASTRLGTRAATGLFGEAQSARSAATAARLVKDGTLKLADGSTMPGAQRLMEAKALVAEAADAMGIPNLGRYVDKVTSVGEVSTFGYDGSKRVVNIGAETLRKWQPGALVDAVHELTHAKQFAALVARRGGNIAAASAEIDIVNTAGRDYLEGTLKTLTPALNRYAAFERQAEANAIRVVDKYLEGVSDTVWNASQKYIAGWSLNKGAL